MIALYIYTPQQLHCIMIALPRYDTMSAWMDNTCWLAMVTPDVIFFYFSLSVHGKEILITDNGHND